MRLAFTLLLTSSLTLFGCATTQSPPDSPQVAGDKPATATTPGVVSSEGPPKELTQETIGTIVRSHFEELQNCYEATLASDNSLAGIVELELTIARDGTIEEGRLIKDGLGSAELNLCLVKKKVDWKFPAHTDESVTIQFPFAFSPKR